FRKGFINRIAAWAIENPKQKVDLPAIFPKHLRRLKTAYFEEHRQKVAEIAGYALEILTDKNDCCLETEKREKGEQLVEKLTASHEYCRDCAKVGLAQLFSKRFEAK
ncbi:MAG: hypothetical protein GY854_00525, partial [Deltaproteobacteria bacterium]|nr:hypothetical protein [Deltaproteobacteria bacterium]